MPYRAPASESFGHESKSGNPAVLHLEPQAVGEVAGPPQSCLNCLRILQKPFETHSLHPTRFTAPARKFAADPKTQVAADADMGCGPLETAGERLLRAAIVGILSACMGDLCSGCTKNADGFRALGADEG